MKINQKKLLLLGSIVFIVVYVAIAYICLRVSAVSGYIALVWPPSGIAVALLLIKGVKFWPLIAIAALLTSVLSGSIAVNIAGVIGTIVEPLVAIYLLRRISGFDMSLERVRDVVAFIIYAACLSTLIGAIFGVTGEYLAGGFPLSAYPSALVSWWVADALGVLVIAPFILQWRRLPEFRLNSRKMLGVISSLVILTFVSTAVFIGVVRLHFDPFIVEYAIFPILIWIALRYGQRGSVTAILLTSFTAVWVPLASPHLRISNVIRSDLLNAEVFMAVSGLTFMVLAASVVETKTAHLHQLRMVERNTRLSQQRARLKALNSAMNDFISIASHQLRTPATAVKQYLGMLRLGYAGELSKVQLEFINAAYESNERQLSSTNDLLNIAQIESGSLTLNIEPTDIKHLLNEIIKSLTPRIEAQQQRINFSYRKNAKYISPADKIKLGMALENLISNASKYSHADSLINVKLSKTPNSITITVIDQGVGMTKADIHKLFKKFIRLENPLSIRAGGMGLGLYWAKKIVDLHGGNINVTSVPSEGSTFEITLPMKTPDVNS